MKRIFKKLLLGSNAKTKSAISPIQKRISNIKSIWHNHHQDDNGIEKIIRLILSTSQLFFPGIYIKQLASKKGHEYQELYLDLYVVLKVVFPILILINHLQIHQWLIGILVYLLLETVLYVPTLIFASDSFSRPRSYKRSMMLLFLNYLEIIFAYGVLYSLGNYLNKPFVHWFDAVYFSTITSSSIGYGDFFPVTTWGKFLVSTQAFLFLFFIVLFLNFFTSNIKSRGYFDHENKE
ncbi:MAG: potassium channel family protein [Bacteroidia bacterium]